jgi:phosphatidylserine decarboxylase
MFRHWIDDLPALHREGLRFILIFAVVTAILFVVWEPLGWLGVILTLWCVYFFRDPARVTPVREGLVVSPADGIVSRIAEVAPPAELGMGAEARTRVSIFMNVFDVHVNRMPVDGVVQAIAYRPGKFVNATLDKASEHNERNGIRVALEDGRDLGVVQIAGLVARRIVCDVREGQAVRVGERLGMIRFGSRLDVYLPPATMPLVIEGQRMLAGETVLADLKSDEGRRLGEIR